MKQERWPSLAAMVQHMLLREEWMSVREAADLYRVSTDTMLAWAHAGKFPYRRIGDELWLARQELHAALCRPPEVSPGVRRSRL
ncbi:MAG TPA: helix-turn-helix domain-containing protein [Roseiflexaceae bacterium]|nr:helix-turn-helix domain-containing protein [Roseiflexaceae bacterium]